MPAEATQPAALRLFAALDIPDSVRTGIETWSAKELTDPALRPTVAQNLHMTLCFIGRTEASRLVEASEAVTKLAPEPVRIRFDRAPVGKPRKRSSVWVLEADAPAAAALHQRLSARLAEAGLYEPEERPFWPHLTVARTHAERGKRRLQQVLKVPGELPAALLEPFDAVRVSLYRSDLRSDGAKYVSLTSLNLPPSPQSLGKER